MADLTKLRDILKKAKHINDVVVNDTYKKGGVDPSVLREDTAMTTKTKPTAQPTQTGYYPNLETSKLPDAVKQAMVQNPIPQAMMPTFSLNDIAEDKEIPLPNSRKQINEHGGLAQNNNNIQESDIRRIVQEEMLSFLTKYFTKTITEDAKKNVVKQLIKEGKLKVKNK